VPQSQSNLTSLATLLESAEARHSALPPPVTATKKREDSGIIDILGLQRRAQEERASAAAAATRTPVPMVAPMRDAEVDVDAMVAEGQRKKKRFLVGAVAGGAALLGIAIGVIGFAGGDPPPQTAAVEAHVAATPAPPAPPPPPAVVAPEPEPTAVAEPVAAAPAPRSKPKKAHASHAKGPQMTKVSSSGVAH
jgi:hypothetical protein